MEPARGHDHDGRVGLRRSSELLGRPLSTSFWKLLDETRPNLTALVLRLEGLDREELEEYQVAFVEAMEAVVPDVSRGIDTGRYVLSEDGMEDFAAWVVGCGRAVFERATSGEDLPALVALMERAESGLEPDLPRWAPTRPVPERLRGLASPRYVALGVYEQRFGGDLAARVEELLDQRAG